MRFVPAHAFSGIAGLALVLAARAQDPGGGPILHHPGPAPELRVAGIYDPRDAVRFGGPYTVPDHKVLVMTALGSFQGGPASVDIMDFWPGGQPEQIVVNTLSTDPIVEFPAPGIVVPAGKLIYGGVVYGYLIDAPDTKGKARRTEPQAQLAHVVGIPGDPRDFVYIRSNPLNPNDSYTVPSGKRLVVTGVGSSRECVYASVRQARSLLLYVDFQPGSLFYPLPAPGILVAGDQVVNPVAESQAAPYTGRVIGYLIDE